MMIFRTRSKVLLSFVFVFIYFLSIDEYGYPHFARRFVIGHVALERQKGRHGNNFAEDQNHHDRNTSKQMRGYGNQASSS